MNKISLDELISNLQTYELRRSSQQKEDTKRDQGLAIKALEEDGSDFDEEEMAMITGKFKKFFKTAKENSKKKNVCKPRGNEHKQVIGCSKCGKRDHIVQNCPLLKKEQDSEQFQNNSARHFSRAMLAAWVNTTEEDEASEEDEAAAALMAKSELDSDDEPVDSLAQLKEKVRRLNNVNLEELLFTLMDEYDAINAENCMLKYVYSDLKKDVRKLEHTNEILESEKLKVDKETLVLYEDLDKFKETLSVREEVFNTNLSKLESESLQLKQRIESLVCENSQLLEKLKKAESDLTALETDAGTVPQKRLSD